LLFPLFDPLLPPPTEEAAPGAIAIDEWLLPINPFTLALAIDPLGDIVLFCLGENSKNGIE
jgi:hypothetical protein